MKTIKFSREISTRKETAAKEDVAFYLYKNQYDNAKVEKEGYIFQVEDGDIYTTVFRIGGKVQSEFAQWLIKKIKGPLENIDQITIELNFYRRVDDVFDKFNIKF